MNEKINDFIQRQSCATICCLDDRGMPYCFNCYYVFDEQEMLLIFKSSPGSSHFSWMARQPELAGTILPDKLSKLFTKGIQFQGRCLAKDSPHYDIAKSNYYKKHPEALAIGGEIQLVRIDRVKFTDSTLGFGKKQLWERGRSAD